MTTLSRKLDPKNLIPFSTGFAGLDCIVDFSKPELVRLLWERIECMGWPTVDIITRVNITRARPREEREEMSTLSSAKKLDPKAVARARWISQMKLQDNKCAECKVEITIDNSAKRGYTNEIICQKCYAKPLKENYG